MTAKEALQKVTVGSVLSVAFGHYHPYQYDGGMVVGVFQSDKSMLFVKFTINQLVCCNICVSEFGDDDQDFLLGKLVINPINKEDIDEQDLAVLMQIDAAAELNDEHEGGLFQVYAIDGKEVR